MSFSAFFYIQGHIDLYICVCVQALFCNICHSSFVASQGMQLIETSSLVNKNSSNTRIMMLAGKTDNLVAK